MIPNCTSKSRKQENRNQELDHHESLICIPKSHETQTIISFLAYISSQLTLFLSGRKLRAVRTMTACVFLLVLLERGKIYTRDAWVSSSSSIRGIRSRRGRRNY